MTLINTLLRYTAMSVLFIGLTACGDQEETQAANGLARINYPLYFHIYPKLGFNLATLLTLVRSETLFSC
ncbi:hypothetical protein NM211_000738 [Vibrio cholerae]|nr:hypothetical protein [Vibrio cholerae]